MVGTSQPPPRRASALGCTHTHPFRVVRDYSPRMGAKSVVAEGASGSGVAPCGAREEKRLSLPPFRISIVVLFALLAFATLLQVGHNARYRQFSPIDELQHFDYLVKAPLLEFPGSGDKIGQEAARAETCSRLDSVSDAGIPACVAAPDQVDVGLLQEQGYNTAYIHPPGYYFIDGVIGRGIGVIPGIEIGTLLAARLAGIVWVWAAVLFLWLLLAELGASLWSRATLIVIVLTAPTVMHAFGTVNPDATAIAIGAAALWAAIRWEKKRTGFWILPLFALIATLTKVTNLVGIGVVLAYLAVPVVHAMERTSATKFRGRWTITADGRERLKAIGFTALPIVFAALVWRFIQIKLQVISPNDIPMSKASMADAFPFAAFTASWHQTFSPLQGGYLAPFLRSTLNQTMQGLVDLLLVAGAGLGALLVPVGSRSRRIALVALGLAVACGPLLVIFNYLVNQIYVVIPPRYGLSLVPALAVAAVPALEKRWGARIGGVVAALAAAGVFLAIAVPAAA